MMHPRFLLSAVLTVLTMAAAGQANFQPGYYITNNNDTIFGEIDNRGDLRNGKICSYRQDKDGDIIQLNPVDIAAYRFTNGKYYVSRWMEIDMETQQVFLEYLVNGMSSLYYHRNEKGDHYFIESITGELTELTNDEIEIERNGRTYKGKSNKYIGQLRTTFSDAPELHGKLDNTKFNHRSLIAVTSEYHDYVCDDEICIIYEKPPPLFRVFLGPVAGISLSGLQFVSFPAYDEYSYTRSTDPVLGLKAIINLPRLNERFSFILQGEYTKSYFFGYLEVNPNSSSPLYRDLHIHISTMKAIFGLQYKYPRGKIRPTAALGPMLSINLDSEFKHVDEMVIGSSVFTSESYENPLIDENYGAFFSLGADWNVTGRQHLGLDLRYHFTKETIGTVVRRDGISLMLGYYF